MSYKYPECLDHGSENQPFKSCFFGWLKQFNHSYPPSTNFNPSYQQQNSTATILNPLQPTSTNFTHFLPLIYHWKKQTLNLIK